MISTSEIKTSVVIDEKYMELAVRALHKAFRPGPALLTPDLAPVLRHNSGLFLET
jgi:hypothetical protein